MATQARIPMRAVRTLSGNPIPRLALPEKAGQTFLKGAVCMIEAASGYVIECSANPTLIAGLANAAGGNTSSSGTNTQVLELAHPDTLFRGYLDNNDGGTGTAAQTDQGKGYGITKSGTSPTAWFVDKNKTTTTVRVVIWEFWTEAGYAGLSDTMPHVIFGWQFAGTANWQSQLLQGN